MEKEKYFFGGHSGHSRTAAAGHSDVSFFIWAEDGIFTQWYPVIQTPPMTPSEHTKSQNTIKRARLRTCTTKAHLFELSPKSISATRPRATRPGGRRHGAHATRVATRHEAARCQCPCRHESTTTSFRRRWAASSCEAFDDFRGCRCARSVQDRHW